MAPPKEARTKRSYVHEYFETVESAGAESDKDQPKKKKCKRCHFVCTPKSSSTSSMQFHLFNSHGISKTSHEVSESEKELDQASASGSKLEKQPSVASFCATKNRSAEEWITRQVVIDGLSLRQLAQSEFQVAACMAMRIKHFKAHSTVGKIVMDFIQKMKEETKQKLTEQFNAGERFSVIADEWTSIRNRRYMNVCVKSSTETVDLGLVRCKGSITSRVTVEMVKVSLLLIINCYCLNQCSGSIMFWYISG